MTQLSMIPWLLAGVFLLNTASGTHAQTYPVDRGSMLLGGTASFSSAGGDLYGAQDGDRHNILAINPRGMFFIAPGLALGGEITVQRSWRGELTSTVLGVGPSVAYYFGGPESRAYPYVGVRTQWSRSSQDSPGLDETRVMNWLAFGGGAGVAVMLSQAVALFLEADYVTETVSMDWVDDSTRGNRMRLQAGIGGFIF